MHLFLRAFCLLRKPSGHLANQDAVKNSRLFLRDRNSIEKATSVIFNVSKIMPDIPVYAEYAESIM